MFIGPVEELEPWERQEERRVPAKHKRVKMVSEKEKRNKFAVCSSSNGCVPARPTVRP